MIRIFLLANLILYTLLAGCASPPAEAVNFTLAMDEYNFTPNSFEMKVGQTVTINMINNGALAHEIMFGRTVKMVNNRPSGYVEDMFTVGGVHPEITTTSEMPEAEHEGEGHTGTMVYLGETGDTAAVTFTVTKDMLGEWEIGCFELDGVHYEQGIHGKFIVNQ